MELHDYVRVVKERWLLIAICVLVTAGVAGALSLRAPETFQSQTRLFIVHSAESEKHAYEAGLISLQRMKTYGDLASGRELANRVAEDLGADSLGGPITASTQPDNLLLTLTAEDPDPERAQQVASAAGENLMEMIAELEDVPGQVPTRVKTTVVDEANLPAAPVPLNTSRNIVLGLAVGLFLGFGLAVAQELVSRSARSARSRSTDPSPAG